MDEHAMRGEVARLNEELRGRDGVIAKLREASCPALDSPSLVSSYPNSIRTGDP